MKIQKSKIYKLNKGEWSEAYCLIKTIAEGRLDLVDSELMPRNEFIKVVGGKISFYSLEDEYEYVINEDVVEVLCNSKSIARIYISAFKDLYPNILEKILKAKDRTFNIDEVQDIFSQVGILRLKSDSSTKKDVVFKIADLELDNEKYLGFSIKSFLAGNPTLINASMATNFVYETEINKKNAASYIELKAKALLRKLSQERQEVKFNKMGSEVYQRNLMLVDTNMPQIIAETLRIYYSGRLSMIKDIANSLKVSNPLKIPDVSIYENKIKDFLFHSALGMFPDKSWDGLRTVDGGCILISSSGELLTFYIIRKIHLEFFREYLFQNCYLDTASTTRHEFGRLVYNKDTEKYFLKLNLQIRVKNKRNK